MPGNSLVSGGRGRRSGPGDGDAARAIEVPATPSRFMFYSQRDDSHKFSTAENQGSYCSKHAHASRSGVSRTHKPPWGLFILGEEAAAEGEAIPLPPWPHARDTSQHSTAIPQPLGSLRSQKSAGLADILTNLPAPPARGFLFGSAGAASGRSVYLSRLRCLLMKLGVATGCDTSQQRQGSRAIFRKAGYDAVCKIQQFCFFFFFSPCGRNCCPPAAPAAGAATDSTFTCKTAAFTCKKHFLAEHRGLRHPQ